MNSLPVTLSDLIFIIICAGVKRLKRQTAKLSNLPEMHIRVGDHIDTSFFGNCFLSRALIGVVESIPGRRIYSVTDTNRLNERVPTSSFRLEGRDPEKVADVIGKQGVYVWNGHNYALAIVEQTRLLEARGDDARGTRKPAG